MKRILIISHNQFGYLTDTLKFCQYSANDYDITYIGWDYEQKRIKVDGVNVKYVSRKTNLAMRNVNLLKAFHDEIKNNYDLVFANYKFGISIVKYFNRRAHFILDIRTLSVNSKWAVRLVNDFFLKLELLFFSEISVISEGVAKKLNLKKFHILPLGGEQFTTKLKSFQALSLLYVGTLYNRDILECVKGFHVFLNDLLDPEEPTPVFTIIGDSPGNELAEIRNYVKLNSLEEKVITVGALPYPELSDYFEKSNVGVSFIPIRTYYEYQPSTKTYEYLLSGLPVLATDTYENRKVITEKSGALIQADKSSFAEGLKEIYRRKDQFDSLYIMEKYARFSWKHIINDNYLSLVKSLTT